MLSKSRVALRCGVVFSAALLAPVVLAQAPPTCNGLPATIVGTVPGQITGTSGDDVIVGTAGNDKIFGLGGNDTICGLGGNDEITGGPGMDTIFGQAGNDTFLWSPGDGNDRLEGATENDVLRMLGANVSEAFELAANGNRIRLLRNVASIELDIAGVERIEIEARGGSDMITLASLIGTGVQQVILDLENADNTNLPDAQPDSIFVFGQPGDDQITVSGSGNQLTVSGAGPAVTIRNPEPTLDTLAIYAIEGNDRITAENLSAGLIKLIIEGGPGKDTITGSKGPDSIVAGDGDDTLFWPLGSPADLLGGEGDFDTLVVLGTSGADNVSLSAGTLEAGIYNSFDKVNFLTDVEHVILQMKSGADQIAISSLPGVAKLQKVTLDLRPSATAPAGDGYPDTIFINGTSMADTIDVAGANGTVTVNGLFPSVVIQGTDYARDTLNIMGSYDADVINAQQLAAKVIRLALRGGAGADTITGSLGDDVFSWFPGDGNDVIEGLTGNDTLQFNGSATNETITLAANGTRLRLLRDVASIVLDVNGVERVTYAALAGSDTIVLTDLGSTAVRQVGVDLAGFGNSAGDGAADTIAITALTNSAIATTVGPGTMGITWAGVRYSVTGVEPGNDRLIVQTAAGAPPTLVSSVESRAAEIGQ